MVSIGVHLKNLNKMNRKIIAKQVKLQSTSSKSVLQWALTAIIMLKNYIGHTIKRIKGGGISKL